MLPVVVITGNKYEVIYATSGNNMVTFTVTS